jgi:hypothetical protein
VMGHLPKDVTAVTSPSQLLQANPLLCRAMQRLMPDPAARARLQGFNVEASFVRASKARTKRAALRPALSSLG